jgi:DNA polymerase IV (DinB-like DNA polymerase)
MPDSGPRIILHVDMDSFYSSVEVREHPEYMGWPVIVGADPKGGLGRGVVSTCSYEARSFGVHSAMPISHAYQRCPDAIFIQPHFALYTRASQAVMEILKNFSKSFEQVSIDEAYLDLSSTGSYEAAEEKAREIKRKIMQEEALPCSIGIAPGRVLAKIASDYIKPDGLMIVTPRAAASFLEPLPVEKIPGIGKKSSKILHGLGIFTIGQLAAADIQQLIDIFGRSAIFLHNLACGIDQSGIEARRSSRSVSREITFDEDTCDRILLLMTLDTMIEDLVSTLVNEDLRFRTVTIKVRYQGFITRTRARTLEKTSRDLRIVQSIAHQLFLELYNDQPVRLIGLKLSGLQAGDTTQKRIDEYMDSTESPSHHD